MTQPFGVIGVFETPEAIKNATRHLRSLGFRAFEAYTPYPVEGLDQMVRPGRQLLLPLTMFGAAVVGAAWGYWIQYWDEALNYPINVGGRPHNSWPAFIVGTFEFMLLAAIAAGLFGLLAASRLPQLYHPLFDAEAFGRASRDRFVLCVEARDPSFEADTCAASSSALAPSASRRCRRRESFPIIAVAVLCFGASGCDNMANQPKRCPTNCHTARKRIGRRRRRRTRSPATSRSIHPRRRP